jgi:hypothetical protein
MELKILKTLKGWTGCMKNKPPDPKLTNLRPT